jgi:hypothetical protein
MLNDDRVRGCHSCGYSHREYCPEHCKDGVCIDEATRVECPKTVTCNTCTDYSHHTANFDRRFM